jgi:4-hydroxy-tetrahydrodipicolinate synthase
MDPHKLRGTFTALVTPMNRDGSLDLGALDALVDAQVKAGIDGLVPCGTTGEAVTLSAEERETVITRVVRRAGAKVTVIAGAGGNATSTAIEAQKRAKGTGAAAALVVTPYYNKPTPEGLYRHYAAIAEAVEFPTVLYNVPGRTGCDMKPDTVARVSSLPGVVAIKEATGDLDRVAAIREKTKKELVLLSGDDGTACPFALLGGDGVISVASNVAPTEMVAMIHAAMDGKVTPARAQHALLRPLFVALFLEANPIPVKAALAMMGMIQESYRLPLCEMSADLRLKLQGALRDGGWLH